MADRPKVLLFIKGLGIGGAEKLISEGARFWDRERFDYRVAYQLPWKDQLVPDLEALEVPVSCVGGRRGTSVVAMAQLRRHIRSNDAALVHAHLPSAGVLARFVSPVPVVYTEHNLAGSYRQPTRVLNRLTYGRNRIVTAVSEAVAESVDGYRGPEPRLIRNGVAVQVTPEEAAAARSELGLSPDDLLVVHVGNIRPLKGHDTLIRATVELSRLRPGVTVISIGGEKHSGDLERVRKDARSAGVEQSLRFLGRRSDALAFVAAADVFVNPSDVEGLPVAILESMALGTPVVATSVGGVPGVVKDGETGLLVEAGNRLGLAKAVDRLLTDRALSDRVSAAGRELVERDFGLEPMVRSFEALYEEILLA